jgi:hypothetical protein
MQRRRAAIGQTSPWQHKINQKASVVDLKQLIGDNVLDSAG